MNILARGTEISAKAVSDSCSCLATYSLEMVQAVVAAAQQPATR